MAGRRSRRPLRLRLPALPPGKAKPYDVAALTLETEQRFQMGLLLELEGCPLPVRPCLLWSLARTHASLAALLVAQRDEH